MRKLFLISALILSVVLISPVMAETGDAGRAGSFMKFGIGARAIGLGGAYTAVAEGIDAVYYNPAGMGYSREREVGFTYHSLTLDRHLNSGAIIYPIRNESIITFSWINSYISDVPMIDSDRNYYDDFSNSNNSFGLSFSKAFFEQLSVGGNLRYVQSKLDQINAYTVGVDLGVIAKPLPQYSIGLTISDLGSNMQWDSSDYWSGTRGGIYHDRYPIRVRGGVAGTFFNEQLLVAADVMKVEDLDPNFYVGGEYWFMKRIVELIEDEEAEDELREVIINKKLLGIRAGYSDGSLTFGGSLYYPFGTFSGGFDYAYKGGKLDDGNYHMFTVRVMF